MDKQSIKREIENWFTTNRPDLTENKVVNDDFINDIYNQIKEETLDLERPAMLIVLREFLGLHYSSETFIVLEELVQEEPYNEIFNKYKEIGFLYNTEMSVVMNMASEKRIVEKYGVETNTLIYEETFREDLKKVLDEYMENYHKLDTV